MRSATRYRFCLYVRLSNLFDANAYCVPAPRILSLAPRFLHKTPKKFALDMSLSNGPVLRLSCPALVRITRILSIGQCGGQWVLTMIWRIQKSNLFAASENGAHNGEKALALANEGPFRMLQRTLSMRTYTCRSRQPFGSLYELS